MQEELINNTQAEESHRFFEYGDLYLKCSCGSEKCIDTGFKHGVSFIMTTKENSFWKVVCSECNTEMTLYFKESSEETILKAKEKEELENKENESIRQGSVDQEYVEGISEDVESNDEPDTSGTGSIDDNSGLQS